MALGKHTHDKDGTFRRERGDSKAGNLAKEYPEFAKVDPRTKLETLRHRYSVETIKEVREALRKK